MSAAGRKLEVDVARTLVGAGGIITAKSVDGAGHQVIAYQLNDREQDFHYSTSTRLNGCGSRNTLARLRREIRELAALPPLPSPIVEAPQLSVMMPEPAPILAALPQATPPNTKRLTKERRKEIAKRYLALPSFAALLGETGIERSKLQTLLLSHRGAPADKLRKELNQIKAEAARRLRTGGDYPKRGRPAKKRRANYMLCDPKRRRFLAKTAFNLYFKSNLTLKETAQRLSVSKGTVLRLVQEA